MVSLGREILCPVLFTTKESDIKMGARGTSAASDAGSVPPTRVHSPQRPRLAPGSPRACLGVCVCVCRGRGGGLQAGGGESVVWGDSACCTCSLINPRTGLSRDLSQETGPGFSHQTADVRVVSTLAGGWRVAGGPTGAGTRVKAQPLPSLVLTDLCAHLNA